MKPNPREEGPRGAVDFLGIAALSVIPTLKNPGRRVGAKLEIEKAVRQLNEELTRLYGIERTARHLWEELLQEENCPRLNDEEKAAVNALGVGLGMIPGLKLP